MTAVHALQPQQGAFSVPPTKSGGTEDEEGEGSDDDEEEEESESEDESVKPKGGLVDDPDGLGPYPQLATAELGLGLSCDVGSAAIVGFDKSKDPRQRRDARRAHLEKADPLLAAWEQQVTAVHVSDQLV